MDVFKILVKFFDFCYNVNCLVYIELLVIDKSSYSVAGWAREYFYSPPVASLALSYVWRQYFPIYDRRKTLCHFHSKFGR